VAKNLILRYHAFSTWLTVSYPGYGGGNRHAHLHGRDAVSL
jgi:hypothetical protein